MYFKTLFKFPTPSNCGLVDRAQEFDLLAFTHMCQWQVVSGSDLKKY